MFYFIIILLYYYLFYFIVCQCFYVKHFESALRMKSALPCLAYLINKHTAYNTEQTKP